MGSLLRIFAVLAGVVLLTACGDDDDAVAAGDDPGAADGTQLLLRFGADRLSAHAGCNHLAGRYGIDGDVLVVEELGGTEMGARRSCTPRMSG